jgi:hypothetical protein
VSGMRCRPVYAAALIMVILIGLPTRLLPEVLPPFMVQYAGDALWALAIFLGLGLMLPKARTRTLFLLAFALTWGIEFSELYQADWINALRAGWLGGLILGYTFLPIDLLLYLCGIGAGVVLEKYILLRH